MKIVFFEPEIPQNTGNVVRTCNVTNTGLILVRPLGFSLQDKLLKRAGLDYWGETSIEIIDDLQAYLETTSAPFYFFSSKISRPYTEISFEEEKNALLIFGSETKGLPSLYFERWKDKFYTIPMKSEARSLNLSNAAAIVLYEALKQQNFAF